MIIRLSQSIKIGTGTGTELGKSYYEKKSGPLIALDVGAHYHQNFLGYRSLVEGIICRYILQDLAAGIIEKHIIFNFRPCNTLFSKF